MFHFTAGLAGLLLKCSVVVSVIRCRTVSHGNFLTNIVALLIALKPRVVYSAQKKTRIGVFRWLQSHI